VHELFKDVNLLVRGDMSIDSEVSMIFCKLYKICQLSYLEVLIKLGFTYIDL
jgi:hypothetical protein